MKTKDIVALVMSIFVIAGSAYFLVRISSTNKPKEKTVPVVEQYKAGFTGKIDKDTLGNINSTMDYGKPNLDNLGRENPFAPLQ